MEPRPQRLKSSRRVEKGVAGVVPQEDGVTEPALDRLGEGGQRDGEERHVDDGRGRHIFGSRTQQDSNVGRVRGVGGSGMPLGAGAEAGACRCLPGERAWCPAVGIRGDLNEPTPQGGVAPLPHPLGSLFMGGRFRWMQSVCDCVLHLVPKVEGRRPDVLVESPAEVVTH